MIYHNINLTIFNHYNLLYKSQILVNSLYEYRRKFIKKKTESQIISQTIYSDFLFSFLQMFYILISHYNAKMPSSGIEPETRGFSVLCSTN